MDFVEKILINTDSDGYTFLVVAFSNVMNKAMESDVIEVMDIISEMCKEENALALFHNIDKYDRNSLLHLAVEYGLKELVSYLLSIKQKHSLWSNKDGYTPLHSAVLRHNAEIINCFLQIVDTCDVNDKMPNGETILHLTAEWGNTEILRELIRHGADLELQDKDGHTTFMTVYSRYIMKEDLKRQKSARNLSKFGIP